MSMLVVPIALSSPAPTVASDNPTELWPTEGCKDGALDTTLHATDAPSPAPSMLAMAAETLACLVALARPCFSSKSSCRSVKLFLEEVDVLDFTDSLLLPLVLPSEATGPIGFSCSCLDGVLCWPKSAAATAR
eukprot:CAMPEP_0178441354 /NCGR_PEP_ID=MMETSP0689_2-20121128/37423_1 /TAXON_ID=160604 /ORGANISM="Amphidinium massartii, Strain CS-259" /LENGTH=132 /DNA_ID=CAMNT_0020064501 /DNA_START=381 /DNA_END=777 /DNA_ORIENTATION=-